MDTGLDISNPSLCTHCISDHMDIGTQSFWYHRLSSLPAHKSKSQKLSAYRVRAKSDWNLITGLPLLSILWLFPLIHQRYLNTSNTEGFLAKRCSSTIYLCLVFAVLLVSVMLCIPKVRYSEYAMRSKLGLGFVV